MSRINSLSIQSDGTYKDARTGHSKRYSSILARAEAAEKERDELLRELTCRSYEEADFVASVQQYADLNDQILSDNDMLIAERGALLQSIRKFGESMADANVCMEHGEPCSLCPDWVNTNDVGDWRYQLCAKCWEQAALNGGGE